MRKYLVLVILMSVFLVGCAWRPHDSGVGFVLKSTDFADPCTQNPGDYPVIYDNHSSNRVDVSFKTCQHRRLQCLRRGDWVRDPTGRTDPTASHYPYDRRSGR